MIILIIALIYLIIYLIINNYWLRKDIKLYKNEINRLQISNHLADVEIQKLLKEIDKL